MKPIKKITFIISLLITNLSFGQTTITIQPNASQGKDALVESRRPTSNFGNSPDFLATSWTNGGTPVTVRALVDFDLTGIPQNAVIVSASLSLYGYTSVSNVGHSNRSGSNESVLRRITQSWDEQTVNWSTQPITTNVNETTLLQSTSVNQHYLNINVTNLVQDMINDTANSHGFLLKLKTEQHYRSLLFASSDNTDSTIRPKLEVTYAISTGLEKSNLNNESIRLFPNPMIGDIAFIELNNFTNESQTVQIISASGSIVKEFTMNSEKEQLNLKELPKGLYIVNLFNGKSFTSKRLIKQ